MVCPWQLDYNSQAIDEMPTIPVIPARRFSREPGSIGCGISCGAVAEAFFYLLSRVPAVRLPVFAGTIVETVS
jgi:hypothetical protein